MLNEIIISVFVSSSVSLINFFESFKVFSASFVAKKSKKITEPVTRFKYVVNTNIAKRRESSLIKKLSQPEKLYWPKEIPPTYPLFFKSMQARKVVKIVWKNISPYPNRIGIP